MSNTELFMNRLIVGAVYTTGVIAGTAGVAILANELAIRQNRKATLKMAKELDEFTIKAAQAMANAPSAK